FLTITAFAPQGLASAGLGGGGAVTTDTINRYRWPTLIRGWDLGIASFTLAQALGISQAGGSRACSGEEDTRGLLERLAEAAGSGMRVMLVHGTADKVIPLASSRSLREAIPGAQLVEMEGSGHCPHEDMVESFVSEVSAFVKGPLPQG
ncbi:unnamed protein product, partial [Chrysoparadoxa australica]